MPSYNKVILVGNLTADPESRSFTNGNSVTEFTIAVNRRYQTADGEKKQEVTFIGAKAFGRMGEVIAKYFRKGKPILIEGRLSQDQWEDRETGAKRSKTYVIAEKFEFVGGDRDEDSAPRESTPPPRETPKPAAPAQTDIDLGDDTLDEDVPF